MCEQESSGLNGVSETEGLLFVVEAEVVDAFHELRNLDVVRRPLDDLRVVASLELETGGEDHLWSTY